MYSLYGRQQQKWEEKRARQKPRAEAARRDEGTDRTFFDHVARDGSKDFTGYPLMPAADPTLARHIARKKDSDEAYNYADEAYSYAGQAYAFANEAHIEAQSAQSLAASVASYAIGNHTHTVNVGGTSYTTSLNN